MKDLTKLTKLEMKKLPALYGTEKVGLKNKVIQVHFFLGGCDWYGVEFDGEDLFWGYCILNNDFHNAEWGYFSLQELASIRKPFMVEKDRYWTVRKASEVEKINRGMNW